MNSEPIVLTRDGYEALRQRLAELQAQAQQQAADVADIVYSGDPMPEEAAEFNARDTEELTQGHIERLQYVLDNAKIVDEDRDLTTIDPGDRVTLWDMNEKELLHYDLVGGAEVIEGHDGITTDSPVGKALIGRRVGDVIEVEAPDGKIHYTIKQIERMK